jgi:predicted heme/steroid binding protein
MNRPSIRAVIARVLVALTCAATGLVAIVLVPGEASLASPPSPPTGGPITRQEIIARAQTWMNRPDIQYSETGGTFEQYRRDCSGFVSMAWNLSAPGLVTGTGPGTGLYTVSHPIAKDELLPGDIMLAPGVGSAGHVTLFAGWTSAAHTHYNSYDFGGSTPTLLQNVPYPYWDSRPFAPYRYNNVIEGQVYEASSANEWRPLPVTGPGGNVTGSPIAAMTVGKVKVVYTINNGQVYEASSANDWRPLPVTGPGGNVTGSDIAAITLNGIKFVYTIINGQV